MSYLNIFAAILVCLIVAAMIQSYQQKTRAWTQYGLLLIGLFAFDQVYPDMTFYALLGVWVIFLVIPTILGLIINRHVVQRRYDWPIRLSRVMAVLFPFAAQQENIAFYKALQQMEDGDVVSGMSVLERIAQGGGQSATNARLLMCLIRGEYQTVITETTGAYSRAPWQIGYRLQALGETGQRNTLITEVVQHEKLLNAHIRNNPRLAVLLCVYFGQTALLDFLLKNHFKQTAEGYKAFWSATCAYVADNNANRYDAELTRLRHEGSALLHNQIAMRLAEGRIGEFAEPLTPASETLVLAFMSDLGDSLQMETPQHNYLVGTWLIFALNTIVFGLTWLFGHDDPIKGYYYGGALFYPAVLHDGQWWRLLTAGFQHYGFSHYAFNMLALFFFPFVERNLGTPRLLGLYALATIGSYLGAVLLVHTFGHEHYPMFMLGASGGIFGIIGVQLGIVLNRHYVEGFKKARARISRLILLMLFQTLIDVSSNHYSHLIHLSGLMTGLAAYFAFCQGKRHLSFAKTSLVMGLGLVFLLFLGYAGVEETEFTAEQAYALGYTAKVTGDRKEAFKWYKRSAEHGYVTGQSVLAHYYANGFGVKKDLKQAAEWCELAAEQGDLNCQRTLIRVYWRGSGVPVDRQKAIYFLRLSAMHGDLPSQYMLGYFYYEGSFVKQDYGQSKIWYELAAKQGYAIAQNNLGDLYETGKGVPQDYARALHWYRKSAAQNTGIAQYNLGHFYREGLGVEKNPLVAYRWYEKALKNHRTITSAEVKDSRDMIAKLAAEMTPEMRAQLKVPQTVASKG